MSRINNEWEENTHKRTHTHTQPPYAIGSVPTLSGHATAYRWRPLPRVRRHGASKPQGSSERVLPWQVTMDQLIFASLSHTHYWYEVGIALLLLLLLRLRLLLCYGGTGRRRVYLRKEAKHVASTRYKTPV